MMAFAMDLMGWDGVNAGALQTHIAFYLVGGFGAMLSGIVEWVCGNTFSSMFLICYGLSYSILCTWELGP